MDITFQKGDAQKMCNILRAISMTKRVCLRPVAFNVGGISTVLSASNLVLEDMLEFSASLLTANYVVDSKKDLIAVTILVNNALTYADLEQEGITVITKDKNKEILHVMSPLEVTIYFRNHTGVCSREENTQFLTSKSNGTLDQGIVVLASRFSDIKNFQFSITDKGFGEEEATITASTFFGDSTESILKDACQHLIEEVEKIQENL